MSFCVPAFLTRQRFSDPLIHPSAPRRGVERRLRERMAHICIEVLTTRGMMKEGKPVFAPEPQVQKKVMWADVEDDE